MKIQWCDRHGSNIGLGLDRCYYAFERSFDFGPCSQSVHNLLTDKEVETVERDAYAQGVNWRVFDNGVDPVGVEHDGTSGWWIPAVP